MTISMSIALALALGIGSAITTIHYSKKYQSAIAKRQKMKRNSFIFGQRMQMTNKRFLMSVISEIAGDFDVTTKSIRNDN